MHVDNILKQDATNAGLAVVRVPYQQGLAYYVTFITTTGQNRQPSRTNPTSQVQ